MSRLARLEGLLADKAGSYSLEPIAYGSEPVACSLGAGPFVAHIAKHNAPGCRVCIWGPLAQRRAGLTSFVGNLRPLGFRFTNIRRIDSPRVFRLVSCPSGLSASHQTACMPVPVSLTGCRATG